MSDDRRTLVLALIDQMKARTQDPEIVRACEDLRTLAMVPTIPEPPPRIRWVGNTMVAG